MDRTRIRWSNLGRLCVVLGAGGLLIAVVPGLLRSPKPAPLPDDVGLSSGASGAAGVYAQAPPRAPKHEGVGGHGHRSPRAEEPHRRPAAPPQPGPRSEHSGRDRPEAPDPTPDPTPPIAAPAPPTAAPAPPPAPDPPAVPEQPPSDPPSTNADTAPEHPHPPASPPAPSQFGFEH